MKRVPAYWGKRQTTPKACPLGKRSCFVYRCTAVAEQWCEHYRFGSGPPNGADVWSCFVNCSAPTKKERKK